MLDAARGGQPGRRGVRRNPTTGGVPDRELVAAKADQYERLNSNSCCCAIVLQTRENALAMGLQGRLGTIEPGMIADILDADPSENIAVVGDPVYVRTALKGGKPVDLAS
jgi:cytosine/adenosine deaminase-related metal-dependent hydrolase